MLDCAEESERVSDKVLASLNIPKKKELSTKNFYQAKGCKKCFDTGFHGRAAIFELLIMHEAIKDLAINKVSTSAIRLTAARLGMRSLREAGLNKITSGITTIEEIMRVTEE